MVPLLSYHYHFPIIHVYDLYMFKSMLSHLRFVYPFWFVKPLLWDASIFLPAIPLIISSSMLQFMPHFLHIAYYFQSVFPFLKLASPLYKPYVNTPLQFLGLFMYLLLTVDSVIFTPSWWSFYLNNLLIWVPVFLLLVHFNIENIHPLNTTFILSCNSAV